MYLLREIHQWVDLCIRNAPGVIIDDSELLSNADINGHRVSKFAATGNQLHFLFRRMGCHIDAQTTSLLKLKLPIGITAFDSERLTESGSGQHGLDRFCNGYSGSHHQDTFLV